MTPRPVTLTAVDEAVAALARARDALASDLAAAYADVDRLRVALADMVTARETWMRRALDAERVLDEARGEP